MEHLIEMKQKLVECVECQMEDLTHVNTHELGEVIDMIKDIDEAIYYCTKAHKIHEEDMEKYCCHCGGLKEADEEGTIIHHSKKKESYLKAKEDNKDRIVSMKELEEYLKELTTEIMEMVKVSSVEEKQLLEKRLQSLTTKISQMNN